VVDHELGATVEQLDEGLRARVGVERVLLVHAHPGKIDPLAGKLVAAACQFLLLG